MDLPTIWFAVIVLAWVLFFVLEGFDFGVGIIVGLGRRPAEERDAAVRTIAPTWDGNEVWLVGAIGLMFAVFPDWYAAVLAGLYLPFVAILLTLALRGVALEFRGKVHGPGAARWKRRCDWTLGWSSLATAGLWGAILTVLAKGLALDPGGEVTSGRGAWRSLQPIIDPAAGLGAIAGMAAALLSGALFLGLRTTGPLRGWSRGVAIGSASALCAGSVLAALAVGNPALLIPAAATALAALTARTGREAVAFTAGSVAIAASVIAAFSTHAPVLLTSTLNQAWSITIDGAASSPEALRVISWAAAFVLPGVLAYQGLSYWVFRTRVHSERITASTR